LPCQYITMPRFAQPSRYFSIQCRCRAYLCKSFAVALRCYTLPCRDGANRVNAMP
jgi:hypothetical protein